MVKKMEKVFYLQEMKILVDLKSNINKFDWFYSEDDFGVFQSKWKNSDKIKKKFPNYHLIIAAESSLIEKYKMKNIKELNLNVKN